MKLVLQTQDNQISSDSLLQQLSDSQLLPQLLREIIIEETIDRVAREYQIELTPTLAEFEPLYHQVAKITPFQGMNSEQLAAITTRTLKLQKFKQAGWGHKVSSYYEIVKDRFQQVSYSILLVEDCLIAQELFFRVQSCEQPFADLAIEYSQDRSAQNGGSIGSILLKEVDPNIVGILDRLKPGELSTLFQLDGYYGFIRLNEMKLPQLDENMHQLLLDELFEDWLQTQLAIDISDNPETSNSTNSPIDRGLPALVDITDRVASSAQQTMTAFAPDFAGRETNLVEDLTDESSVVINPEVVVDESEDEDLTVSTNFFFPDRAKPE
jgi:parvulin-like peptidyl-prolyl isomerase